MGLYSPCWRGALCFLLAETKNMNAAEEIVKYWYQSKGYFVMDSLRIPKGRNKEIDLLAIKLSNDKKKVADKIHIEVSVSNNSMWFEKGSVEKIIKAEAQRYHAKKFEDSNVKQFATQLIGSNYKMVEIRGKMALNKKDVRPEYIKERMKMGVEVIPFETILKDINEIMLSNIQANPIIQTVQLIKYQI